MSEPLLLRAAWALGTSLLSWSLVFVVLRIMHRRDRVLDSPEIASWQDDALAAIPLALLVAGREVLRSVIGRERPLAFHVVTGVAIAITLSVALRRVRRGRQASRSS